MSKHMKQVSQTDTRIDSERNRVAGAPEAASGSLLSYCLQLDIHAAISVSKMQIRYSKSTYKMMSSTALPKVTFMSDPMVSPISAATLSVA